MIPPYNTDVQDRCIVRDSDSGDRFASTSRPYQGSGATQQREGPDYNGQRCEQPNRSKIVRSVSPQGRVTLLHHQNLDSLSILSLNVTYKRDFSGQGRWKEARSGCCRVCNLLFHLSRRVCDDSTGGGPY
jgi:hypothetical protein